MTVTPWTIQVLHGVVSYPLQHVSVVVVVVVLPKPGSGSGVVATLEAAEQPLPVPHVSTVAFVTLPGVKEGACPAKERPKIKDEHDGGKEHADAI